MWPPNSRDLNPVDYYSVLCVLRESECQPFADPWCEEIERTSAEGVEAAGPRHHHTSSGQWRSRLCVCVNCGHFGHKFWTCVFLLCFVRLCNCKTLILREMHYFCVWDFYTYGSDKTNVWQNILAPFTLALSCEVSREKMWKSVYIYTSYSEKSAAPYLFGHPVYNNNNEHWQTANI